MMGAENGAQAPHPDALRAVVGETKGWSGGLTLVLGGWIGEWWSF